MVDLRATRAQYGFGTEVYDVLSTQIAALEARIAYLQSIDTGSAATDFLIIDDVCRWQYQPCGRLYGRHRLLARQWRCAD